MASDDSVPLGEKPFDEIDKPNPAGLILFIVLGGLLLFIGVNVGLWW